MDASALFRRLYFWLWSTEGAFGLFYCIEPHRLDRGGKTDFQVHSAGFTHQDVTNFCAALRIRVPSEQFYVVCSAKWRYVTPLTVSVTAHRCGSTARAAASVMAEAEKAVFETRISADRVAVDQHTKNQEAAC
jgi:hypothetical protein